MTKLNVINCSNEECGKEFKQRKPTSQYCSVECVKEAKNSKIPLDRICLNNDCKQQFSVQRRSDKKKYCSLSCASYSNKNIYKSKNTCNNCKTQLKEPRLYCESCLNNLFECKNCKFCNQIFRLTKRRRDFCSLSCKKDYSEKLKERICQNKNCKKEFYARKINEKATYCSKQCFIDSSKNTYKEKYKCKLCKTILDKPRVYCSPECRATNNVKKVCAVCPKNIPLKSRSKFCSISCKQKNIDDKKMLKEKTKAIVKCKNCNDVFPAKNDKSFCCYDCVVLYNQKKNETYSRTILNNLPITKHFTNQMWFEWDYTRNNGFPYTKYADIDAKFWWICKSGHSWESSLYNRSKNSSGCTVCSGRKAEIGVNDLQTLYPALAKEWDYKKNSKNPEDYVWRSRSAVHWKCLKHGHEAYEMITRRVKNKGCGHCNGIDILAGFNDLATTHPDLATEWDFEKNNYKPSEIMHSNHKYAYWVCDSKYRHKWRTTVYLRANTGSKCPKCYFSSKPEKELALRLRSIYSDIKIVENDRKLLEGKELDIYIPDRNIAIEFNGDYWHSTKFSKKRQDWIKVHKFKQDMCLKKSINLLFIWEYDWKNNKEQILDELIKYFGNLSINKEPIQIPEIFKKLESIYDNPDLYDPHI